MVITGLEAILDKFPYSLKRKRIGILCHSASINSNFEHIIDIFYKRTDCKLSAIFGPQHGIYGQTQDNMIEWQSHEHKEYKVPLFSLYGENRKPTSEMLRHIDILLIDLQDVGARLYTYTWTVKLCIEACAESGIPVMLLDRPNPIGRLPFDGPVLQEQYFSFVGGASIPLCHRMTIGEMAVWIKEKYYPGCDLKVMWMKNWRRSSTFSDTGLPWIFPSPNMPTLNSALVYPGTVLIEALNISEGRGTTIPFELLGAPFIDSKKLIENLNSRRINGCAFRSQDFIPTFNKYSGELCHGIQIHITDIRLYKPVETALEIFNAIIETCGDGYLKFNLPPYEYEYKLMPFDILSGDSGMRDTLVNKKDLRIEKERWSFEIEEFRKEFSHFAVYSE
jgi:uncharacterized protein YbbC (DUF1343 family)